MHVYMYMYMYVYMFRYRIHDIGYRIYVEVAIDVVDVGGFVDVLFVHTG